MSATWIGTRLCLILGFAASALSHGTEPGEQEVLARLAESETNILFWSQADRRIGFRHIAELLPSRLIELGDSPSMLRDAPINLSAVRYQVEGQDYALSDYLDDPGHVGLIVVRGDDVLFEHYSDGNDRESLWISFSVAKSVTSMLIGAAIKDGFIQSIDDPVVDYLPHLQGAGYARASIRDVLRMASGVRWNEDYTDPASDVARAGGANGVTLLNYLAKLPAEHEPGATFNYNTGESNLVGQLLRAAIGNNAATYLSHKIWRPFGMEHAAYWSLDEVGGGELGGCCINASLRDYARLGQFAMRDGVLPSGERVLSEGWMNESIEPSEGYEGYGYLWWLYDDGSYAARGIFGQLIQVYPDDDLVIATHGNAGAATGTGYRIHQGALVPAIRAYLGER